jgi:hypothetical protein
MTKPFARQCIVCRTIETEVDGKDVLLSPSEYNTGDYNIPEIPHLILSKECFDSHYGKSDLTASQLRLPYVSCKEKKRVDDI